MAFRYTITALSILFLLSGCRSEPEETSDSVLSATSEISPILQSTWIASTPFMSTRYIHFNADGTFEYYSGGCISKSYSKGSWYREGDYVICTSYEEYKKQPEPEFVPASLPEPEPEPEWISSLPEPDMDSALSITPDSTLQKELITYRPGKDLIIPAISSITINTGNFGDSSHAYFERTILRIRGNIMYELDNYGYSTESKYYLEGTYIPPYPPVPYFTSQLPEFNNQTDQ